MSSVPDALRVALADRYRIERELGTGGMAKVYLAHDLKHDRKVAIKVVRQDLMDTQSAERFLAEIRTAATLQHPHILGLIDSGVADGAAFYVMPHVTGESLRERLTRERQLSVEETVRIGREVALALDYAHRQGVVHRDIKPENVLLQDGQAMVADFGIALATRTASTGRMTETGLSPGSPQYMSPEQATGERIVDGRSDVYSLGCVVYEMLTGGPPFTGPTPQALMARHAVERAPRIRTVRASVSPALERVVLKAMEKVPADRYASAVEFEHALGLAERAPGRFNWKPKMWRVVALGALAAGLYLIVAETPKVLSALRGRRASLQHQRIAVLYFESPANDSDLRAVADGLTDGLIDTLGRVPQLEVISRNGVLPFRGVAVRPESAGRVLEVGVVLAGTVERTEDRLRVSARLVDAVVGVSSEPRVLEGSLAEVIAMQGHLATAAITLLRKRQQAHGAATAAWMLLQRGEAERRAMDAAAGDTVAIDRHYRNADSLYAAAQAGDDKWPEPAAKRALIAYRRSRLTRDPAAIRKWIAVGLPHADKALQIDPDNADALEHRGNLHYWAWLANLEEDATRKAALIASAKADLEKATSINRSQAGAWATLSHLYNNFPGSSSTDVLFAARRAYEADPYIPEANRVLNSLFLSAYDMGRFGDADSVCNTIRVRYPTNVRASRCMLYMLTTSAKVPDIAAAWKLADSVVALSPPGRYTRLSSDMLVAMAIGRASKTMIALADSAQHVIRRSEGNAMIDPTRDLAFLGAMAYTMLGDKADAIRLLKINFAVNPQRREAFRNGGGWPFESLKDDPDFKKLVGAADAGSAQPRADSVSREKKNSATSAKPTAVMAPATDPRRVVVFGLQNGSIGRMATEMAPLRAAVTDFVITDIATLPNVHATEGGALAGAEAKQGSSVATAAELGKRAGAASVIVGVYVGDATGRMRVAARLIDVASDTVSATVNAEGLQDSMLVPIANVAAQVKCQIELKVLGATSCAATKPGASTASMFKVPFKAVMLYSRGLEESDRGNRDKAIELFKQSPAAYPGYEAPRRDRVRLGVPVPP